MNLGSLYNRQQDIGSPTLYRLSYGMDVSLLLRYCYRKLLHVYLRHITIP